MTSFLIAFIGTGLYIYICCMCDEYLTTNTTLERIPILTASLLWPVAVAIAVVRIVISFVIGKGKEQ